jgi:hypothetical protein
MQTPRLHCTDYCCRATPRSPHCESSPFNLLSASLPLLLIAMEQTHTRATEALQSFIHLARSSSASSPRFIANLITNATSSPQTYVFAELLELPAVQALRSPETPVEFQGYLKLLEIFAWGTWQEYQGKIELIPRNETTTTGLSVKQCQINRTRRFQNQKLIMTT